MSFAKKKFVLKKYVILCSFFVLILKMTLILLYDDGLVKGIVNNIWFSRKIAKNQRIFEFSEYYLDTKGNVFLKHFIAIL